MTGRVVEKRLEIDRPLEATFELFTDRMGEWWPLATHSIYADQSAEIIVEGRAGGEIFEQTADGRRARWGVIEQWDPPNGFRVRWRPSLDPGPETTWEVRFRALGEGRTALELDHWGWEAFGEKADELADEYTGGWDMVLSGLTTNRSRAAR